MLARKMMKIKFKISISTKKCNTIRFLKKSTKKILLKRIRKFRILKFKIMNKKSMLENLLTKFKKKEKLIIWIT